MSVKPDIPDTPPEVIRDSIPASLPTVFVMNTAKQVCLSSVKLIRNLWFNHTGCLQDRDRDQDREWVVWFYVEPFTLHLNRDRVRHLLSPLFWFWFWSWSLSQYRNTASVITPLDIMKSQMFCHHRRLFRHHEILEFSINATNGCLFQFHLVSEERYIANEL